VIDPTKPITIKTLVDSGLVKDVKFGVKLLGKVSVMVYDRDFKK
jgi:hypothetical protein